MRESETETDREKVRERERERETFRRRVRLFKGPKKRPPDGSLGGFETNKMEKLLV